MTASPEPPFGIIRVAPFAGFVQRFEDLIGSSTTLALYFIHSRRWRENHDAAIKAFLARAGTALEAFLPDLESHELMFSLGKHFEDGPLIPSLVADAYRYFARLARDFGKPTQVWLFGRYPTYSFYKFDQRAVIELVEGVRRVTTEQPNLSGLAEIAGQPREIAVGIRDQRRDQRAVFEMLPQGEHELVALEIGEKRLERGACPSEEGLDGGVVILAPAT